MAVAVAGSTMHFLQAIFILFLLYAFVGVPGGSLTQDREWEVGSILPDSAAAAAGLQPGDRVLSMDGRQYDTFTDFATTVSEMPGENIDLTVQRDGRVIDVPVEVGVNPDDRSRGLLGIKRDLVTTTVGPFAATGAALGDFADQTTATFGFIGDFFSPSGIANFAGDVAKGQDDSTVVDRPTGSGGSSSAEQPDDGRIISIVGAVRIGADLTENGLLGFLLFFVGINITIGIFNLLPLLPLDGGHVVIATYERIREALRPGRARYHVDMARLLPLVYAVFVLLVMLGITTIYLDVIDPVSL